VWVLGVNFLEVGEDGYFIDYASTPDQRDPQPHLITQIRIRIHTHTHTLNLSRSSLPNYEGTHLQRAEGRVKK
jgi:hypothetical protein